MADQVIRNYKKPVGTSSKDSKADIAKAKFKQAQKEGNVQKNEIPFGPGGIAKVAGKVIAKVVGKEIGKEATAAVPSKIVTKGASYGVEKTSKGEIKLTTDSGNTVTFPKGVSGPKVAGRMQEGQTLFGDKGLANSMRAKTGRTK